MVSGWLSGALRRRALGCTMVAALGAWACGSDEPGGDASADAAGDAADEADGLDLAGDDDAMDAADHTDATDARDLGDAPPADLRVVTLNLRCLIDDWPGRLPILVDALAAIDPHLMGFQEACAETGADNVAELLAALTERTGVTYSVERVVTHLGWDRYDEGIAVAVAAPIVDTQAVGLPGGTFPRRVLMVRVDAPLGPLVFATTHLDHASDVARAAQIDRAIEALDDFADDGEARILTGDFNEGPDAGQVHGALEAAGYTDVWTALADPGDPGLTMPSTAPAARIDYIWLDAGDLAITPLSVRIFLDEPVDGVFGSDHFGVTAGFGLPGSPTLIRRRGR